MFGGGLGEDREGIRERNYSELAKLSYFSATGAQFCTEIKLEQRISQSLIIGFVNWVQEFEKVRSLKFITQKVNRALKINFES